MTIIAARRNCHGPTVQLDGLGAHFSTTPGFAPRHKRLTQRGRRVSLSECTLKPSGIEIVQATPADVGAVAPLFDAYRQFYKKPSNEEAARRFLFARLSKGESVLFFARHGKGAQSDSCTSIRSFPL